MFQASRDTTEGLVPENQRRHLCSSPSRMTVPNSEVALARLMLWVHQLKFCRRALRARVQSVICHVLVQGVLQVHPMCDEQK